MNSTAELEHAITSALLEELTRDEPPIREIHSCDIAEDGETMVITLSMGDGSDTFISLTPGRPISIYRTAPQPEPARHLFCVRNSPS